MKLKSLIIAVFLLVSLTTCKDEEITRVEDEGIVSGLGVLEGDPIAEEDKISVEINELNIESPNIQLRDDKGRLLQLSENKIIAEKETTIMVYDSEIEEFIYLGYIGEKNGDENNAGRVANVCGWVTESNESIGIRSTAKYLLTEMLFPIVHGLLGIDNQAYYETGVADETLCNIFSNEEFESFVDELSLLDVTKGITKATAGPILETITSKSTGGLFTDCFSQLPNLILDHEVEYDLHPQQEIDLSLITYNHSHVHQPSLLNPFISISKTGLIIKDSEKLENGNYIITFNGYNSLPYLFGIRSGSPNDDENDIDHFILPHGSGTIKIIKEGLTCSGFINNIEDIWFGIANKGVSPRNSDYTLHEDFVLEFESTDNQIQFISSTNSIKVAVFEVLLYTGKAAQLFLGLNESVDGKNNELLESFLKAALDDQEILNIFNNDVSIKIRSEAIGKFAKNWMSNHWEDIVKEFTKNKSNIKPTTPYLKLVNLGLDFGDLGLGIYEGFNKEIKQDVAHPIYIPDATLLIPNLLSPEHQTEVNEKVISLQWDAPNYTADNQVQYDVFLSASLNENGTPSGRIAQNLNATTFQVENLVSDQTYYWRVMAKFFKDGTLNHSELSPVWSFNTNSLEQTITTPTLLTPSNGATNIANNTASVLSWTESVWTDASNTEPISYDLYFGTNTNPPKHQFIPSGYTSPNVLSTEPNTTYYWKVVARDGQGTELASSEIWSFTTNINTNNIYIKEM